MVVAATDVGVDEVARRVGQSAGQSEVSGGSQVGKHQPRSACGDRTLYLHDLASPCSDESETSQILPTVTKLGMVPGIESSSPIHCFM